MIKMYKNFKNSIISLDYDKDFLLNNQEMIWVNMVSPTYDELQEIAEITKLPMEFLSASYDNEESAHVEIEDDSVLVVLDTPLKEEETFAKYTTVPFLIVYNNEYFVTISQEENMLSDLVAQRTKKIQITSYPNFTLQFLYRLTTSFITSLKRIDIQTKELEKKLHRSTQNKELFELMDINKTLVFFSTALNANKMVISKLSRLGCYKNIEENADLLEDAIIENNQAIEMCSIYRGIISGMQDVYASIISNNLNIVMKSLAVITIVLSIPTIIASFYGMNFDNIPLDDYQYGFYIIVGASIIISLICAIIVIVYSKNIRIRKK